MVTHGNTKEQTIVEPTQEGMFRVPLVFIEGLHTFVSPSTDCFVSCKLLRIEELAQEARCTSINTINIRIAIGTTITSDSHVGIALIEEVLRIDGHIGARVNGLHVQITYAGSKSQTERNCCNRKEGFNI